MGEEKILFLFVPAFFVMLGLTAFLCTNAWRRRKQPVVFKSAGVAVTYLCVPMAAVTQELMLMSITDNAFNWVFHLSVALMWFMVFCFYIVRNVQVVETGQ